MKSLDQHLKDYLALRRGLGFKLRLADCLLRQFIGFAKDNRVSHVTTDLAISWATQPTTAQPATWADRYRTLRLFAKYLSTVDVRTEVPPAGLLSQRRHRKSPCLYTDEEVIAVIRTASKLPSPKRLRGMSLSTFFGLVAATGMRVGEAVALNRDDVSLSDGLLTIHHPKGGRTRLVPIHASTYLALQRYQRLRNRICPQPNSPSFFLTEQGIRFNPATIRSWFARVSRQTGLRGPADRRGPRLHDLRHRFAIQAVLRWYRAGQNAEVHMPALSTYLGHRHVSGTYWYLSATPELLQEATRRWRRGKGGPKL
jgi:integrase